MLRIASRSLGGSSLPGHLPGLTETDFSTHRRKRMIQESTIFELKGSEFVRKHTTLQTEGGKTAAGTHLDHANPGYAALMQKKSYTGEVNLFGHMCDAHYAPLTDKDGKLTGALMVCLRK
jgi:hypothetical protein